MAILSSTPEQATESRIAGWLSPEEFALLEGICATLLPSLEPPPGSSAATAAYYRRSASDLRVARLLAEKLGREGRETQAAIRLFLSLFTAPPIGLLLVGQARPFLKLSQEKRERYLLALANSPVGPFRQGFQGLKRLAGLIYFSTSNDQGSNPAWPVLGYPAPPAPAEQPRTIFPLAITQDMQLEADVVVIGSGAGGGVVAGELARAGKSVIVLEKGRYHDASTLSWREEQAMPELFLKRGALSTSDLAIIMLAGETLGGGTTVNWMTSLHAPYNVLQEWDELASLRDCFTGDKLRESYAAVERSLSVNIANSQHNRQNQLLFQGVSALGYRAEVSPRNAVGCEQRCGYCTMGCRYGCSQSTLKTYLQEAYNHGARIIVDCEAQRVLLEQGRATGVQARVTQDGRMYNLQVRAPVVVVAAGALVSPLILQQSGLEHPHLGRHLHLHPTAISVGVYPEPVNAWEGVLQSAYSDQFSQMDGTYGYTLEVAPTHPGLFGMATPWYSARNYRDEMTSIAHLASFIVLTRDQSEGSVMADRAGEPVIRYAVNRQDRRHLLHGLRQGTRIHLAAGAERVISLQNHPTDLRRSPQEPVTPAHLRAFDRLIEQRGLGPNRVVLFSAHQMGTCRMGASPRTSVTDEHQQVHGIKGLFVCDSSVFPNACGVNPMLTIMALAHKASQYIKTYSAYQPI